MVPGGADIHVFRFPPTSQRPFETYATLARRMSRFELVSHAPTPDPDAAAALASIKEADFTPYALVQSSSPVRLYVLVPPFAWVRGIGGRALAERLKLGARDPASGWNPRPSK